MSFSLTFKTNVLVTREQSWEWITSVEGISKEMSPILKMTIPKHVRNIANVEIVIGKPLLVSIVLLFGILPIDYSKLTLVEIDQGDGFIEQSPMGSMKLWRHERKIFPSEKGSQIVDKLLFQPRFLKGLLSYFVKFLFIYRHKMLAKHLGRA